MSRTMTAAQIAELNAKFEIARERNPDESTHILTHDVAIAANLTVIRRDDESGILYRNNAGELVYGWESGGFSEPM